MPCQSFRRVQALRFSGKCQQIAAGKVRVTLFFFDLPSFAIVFSFIFKSYRYHPWFPYPRSSSRFRLARSHSSA